MSFAGIRNLHHRRQQPSRSSRSIRAQPVVLPARHREIHLPHRAIGTMKVDCHTPFQLSEHRRTVNFAILSRSFDGPSNGTDL